MQSTQERLSKHFKDVASLSPQIRLQHLLYFRLLGLIQGVRYINFILLSRCRVHVFHHVPRIEEKPPVSNFCIFDFFCNSTLFSRCIWLFFFLRFLLLKEYLCIQTAKVTKKYNISSSSFIYFIVYTSLCVYFWLACNLPVCARCMACTQVSKVVCLSGSCQK